MDGLTLKEAPDSFESHQVLARKAKEAMNSDQGAQQFQQEFSTIAQKGEGADDLAWEWGKVAGNQVVNQMVSQHIETASQDGFHLDKISSDTTSVLQRFGMQLKNDTYQWKSCVEFTPPDWSKITVNDQPYTSNKFRLDADTLLVTVLTLRQDGFNNPNAPLRIEVKNADGTIDHIIITKPRVTPIAQPESQDALSAKGVNQYIANFSGDPKALLDSSAWKPYFDALVKHWSTVSDATVAKVKLMIGAYARENYGVNIPSDAKFAPTTTKLGEPALQIAGTNQIIFNSNKKDSPVQELRPKKTGL